MIALTSFAPLELYEVSISECIKENVKIQIFDKYMYKANTGTESCKIIAPYLK